MSQQFFRIYALNLSVIIDNEGYHPCLKGVIMRVKSIPSANVKSTSRRKNTRGASVTTPLFGPNSVRPLGDSPESVAREQASKLRERNFKKIAETLYKSGVITLTTFDRECSVKGKDRVYLRHIFSLLLAEKVKAKKKKVASVESRRSKSGVLSSVVNE